MMILFPILLVLVSSGALVLLVLLVGYGGLLLVRYLLRSLQHSAASPVFVPQPVQASVRPSQQPQQARPAATNRGSVLRGTILSVLGLSVGVVLPLSWFSVRRVEVVSSLEQSAIRQTQQFADRAQILRDDVSQPQANGIPWQPDPGATAVQADEQAVQPVVSDRPQLLEVASQIGQLFQSQLKRTAESGVSPAEVTGGPEADTGTAGESADGDVVVYQFSEQMLADLFGSEAIDTLRSISQQMPPGIRNSYALIPLPGTVGATVPPMKPLLASSGLRSLADSLVQLLKTGPADGQQASPGPAKSLQQQPEVPGWVHQPAAGHRVARAEILPGEDTEEKVRESVEELLLQELRSSAAWIPATLRQSALQANVTVAAGSVSGLVRNRFERVETLDEPIDGASQLQVIWTEIELPQGQLLSQLSLAAGMNRGRLLVVGVLVIWLGLVVAAISSRLWTAGGLVARMFSLGTGVMSIALLVAVVLVPLQAVRGVVPGEGSAMNGTVVWYGPAGDVSITL